MRYVLQTNHLSFVVPSPNVFCLPFRRLSIYSPDKLLKSMDSMTSASGNMEMQAYGDTVFSALIALDWPR